MPLAGDIIRAAEVPSNVAWTLYVPVWMQGATVINKTVQRANYVKTGRKVEVDIVMVASSAGVANNRLTVSMPFPFAAGSSGLGKFFYNDSGTAIYNGVTLIHSGSEVRFFTSSTPSNTDFGLTGGGFAAAVAPGDGIYLKLGYESAI